MVARGRPNRTITRDSVEDQIYRSLRSEILGGEYAEGERLVQLAIANRMGTSRIPVRDALKRLEADGLLIKGSNGSYYCKTFGAEDLEEIYTLRMLLEPMALRKAIPRLDDDAIQYLRELLEAMDQAVEDGDQERYVDINREFHMAIYEPCEQTRLIQIIKGLWLGRPLFIAGDLGKTGSAAEHHSILNAIEQGNVEDAARQLKNHIEGSLRVLLTRLPGRGKK